MICFEGETADSIWRQALVRLHETAPVQESRDQTTRELLHVAFSLRDPRQRLVFARPINPAFAIAEVIWILSGANDAAFLQFWNPRMTRFTDEDKSRFYGAYGFRLGSQPRLSTPAEQALRHEPAPGAASGPRADQLKQAYEALRNTSHSRQVVLQIWDHQLDLPNPEPRSRDIPCNLMSHLLVRDGKLEWLQVMRSNDLIWGTPYNFIQWTTVQEIVAGWLGLELGAYTHISDSLHVYERHWTDLEHSDQIGDQALTATDTDDAEGVGSLAGVTPARLKSPRNQADLRLGPYEAWEAVWVRLVDAALALTKAVEPGELRRIGHEQSDLPLAYAQWAAVLTAEALRRRGFMAEAKETIAEAGAFWERSWLQWAQTAPQRATSKSA